MNSFKVPAGAGIAIFGTGAVGLAAVMAARIVGAGPIIGVDIKPKRLELARELGATDVINARREDIAARIANITGAASTLWWIRRASRRWSAWPNRVLKPRGRVALLTGDIDNTRFPPRGDCRHHPGRRRSSALHPQLIDLYRAGRFPFDRLVKFYDFKDINQAIADSRKAIPSSPSCGSENLKDDQLFLSTGKLIEI